MREKRGDEKTFCSESHAFSLASDGTGPVATAFRTQESSVVKNAASCPNFKRSHLAEDFGVVNVYFAPNRHGVVEYGTPK